ncbi:MAG: NmrA family NAD(P)-binding protein [Terriglobia bacterium]
MFLITGITGKVGGAAARHLLDKGKQVRALVRDPAKAAAWSAKGVELVKGDWADPVAMTQALNGVEGAYLMMPPIQTPSRDFREAKAVISSYKEALAKSAPPKLVVLSSMGSEKSSGLGLITATHLIEQALGNEPFPVAFVRAGSFLENYLFGIQAAQGGTLPIFYAPTDRKLPMIATEDIGAEIAKLLTTEWTGKRIIELGSLVSADDLAAALGKALGRDVKAQAIPRQAWAGALQQMGMPAGGTWAFEEMVDGVNSGWIGLGVEGTERVEGTTSAKDVFAAAANQAK